MRIINKYILILVLLTSIISLSTSRERYNGDAIIVPRPVSPNVIIQQVRLGANNINSWFYNTGIFNQDLRTTNTPGLEWPFGSGHYACFTAGLSIGAYVDGILREAMCSYKGEYAPGYVDNSSGSPVAVTNSKFRIYKVAATDKFGSGNPDFDNWVDMIPFGAPYVDVNQNGSFDPQIDRPGKRDAAVTIFGCLTDGFPEEHKLGEGFGGGTAPLYAELHFTAWAYDTPGLEDIQFVNWVLINKNTKPWTSTYMGVVVDPDLGNADDDYIGCDTALNLGYCYNGDDDDEQGSNTYNYGLHPPAFGMDYFTSAVNRTTGDTLGLTSFVYFSNTSCGTGSIPCENDPLTEPIPAYYMLKGLKKDQTPWVVPPGGTPDLITKFTYPGDPESGQGWNEGPQGTPTGSIQNCGGPNVLTGTQVTTNIACDRRFIFNSGADDFTMNMNDTQSIVLAQFVARGNTNKNSVTKLKELDIVAQRIFDADFNVIPPPPQPVVTRSYAPSTNTGTYNLHLSWTDTSEYYNYWDTLFSQKDDSAFYKFEGYEIYEVRRTAQTLPNFNKPETINTDDIRLVAIYDKKDAYGIIVDTFSTGTSPTGTPLYAPFPIVPPYKLTGQPGFPNTGLNRSIIINSTAFTTENGGTNTLIYGHEYKFAIMAYAYNTNPKRGQATIRNSLGTSIITIKAEAPLAGSNFYYKNGDTLNTSKRDLGVIPIVVAQEKLVDAKYRVVFTSGSIPDVRYDLLKSVNNGPFEILKSNLSTTLTSLVVEDSARIYDGILFKVVGIRSGPPYNNSSILVGVIKDPGTKTVDTIQTRYRGWDYNTSGTRNLEGSKYLHGPARPWQSVSMSLSYPTSGTYTNIGSLYKPDSLKNVKIVFTGYGSGQKAYRYSAASLTSYAYQDMKDVPFKVYEIETTDNTPEPRQLNCAFLEFPDGAQDGKWEPTTDTTGGKDVLYIFGSDYSETENPFYTQKNLLLTTSIDVMYVWSAKLINPGPAFNVNDELVIYPYTVTKPGVIYEINTKRPQMGITSVAVENSDLDNIKVVPNPYYGYNSLESQSTGRFITFRRLPPLCTFKIYSLNGDLIKTLEKTDENSSTLTWNMTNLENVPVASGMYIVLVDAPGIGQKVLKVAIFTPQERIDF